MTQLEMSIILRQGKAKI